MNSSFSQGWLRAGLAATVAVSAFLIAGCAGGSKKEGKVVGKVTYGGETLGGGKVTLLSAGEHPQTFTANINSDGSYDLVGVPAGEYFVGVETESVRSMSGGMYNMGGAKPPPGVKVEQQPKLENAVKYVQIPAKYRDPKTSGLPKINVQQGSKTPQNIEIPK